MNVVYDMDPNHVPNDRRCKVAAAAFGRKVLEAAPAPTMAAKIASPRTGEEL